MMMANSAKKYVIYLNPDKDPQIYHLLEEKKLQDGGVSRFIKDLLREYAQSQETKPQYKNGIAKPKLVGIEL